MSLSTFLRKELAWSRHRTATVLVLFVIVPSVMATGTLFFEHTVPENSPVAVTPAGDEVTGADLEVVQSGLTFVADPRIVDSSEAAFSQLQREEVYAVVEVPPGFALAGLTGGDGTGQDTDGATDGDGSTAATLDVTVHGSVTIFRMPAQVMIPLLSDSLDQSVPGSVDAELHVRGEEKRLSEYLLPTFMMLFVMVATFVYLPASLAREENVFDRLRTKSSMRSVIGAKLLFVAGLTTLALATIYVAGVALGYSLQPPSPVALGAYLLVFGLLASVAVSISLLTEFGVIGRVLNVGVFFALIPLSNLAYPAGFFSELSRTIARHNPLHYAMIVARSHQLKEVGPGTFADWIGVLVVVTLAALAVLALAIRRYERTR